MRVFVIVALLCWLSVARAGDQAPAISTDEPGPARSGLSVRELLSLRDVGGDLVSASISPSGRLIAFQVQEADITANTYHSAWNVVATSAQSRARRIASGGDVMLTPAPFGRLVGTRLPLHARWSPDEQWIAYLRRDGDQVQVWRARVDGSREEQVTHSAANVNRFAWRADGKGIFFETARDRAAMAQADKEEGQHGFLVDDRFITDYSSRPLWFSCTGLPWYPPMPASQPCVRRIWTVDFGSSERPASASESRMFAKLEQPDRPAGVETSRDIRSIAWNRSHTRTAWLENLAPQVNRGFRAPLTLYARLVPFLAEGGGGRVAREGGTVRSLAGAASAGRKSP